MDTLPPDEGQAPSISESSVRATPRKPALHALHWTSPTTAADTFIFWTCVESPGNEVRWQARVLAGKRIIGVLTGSIPFDPRKLSATEAAEDAIRKALALRPDGRTR